MGSRGPLPKPAERRVGHHAEHKPVSLELVPVRQVVPEPPDGLNESALESWDIYWRSDVARVASEVDLPVVRRYFVLLDQYERAIEVVNKAIVVKGSTRQIRTNPLADYALKLAGQLLRLEEELGLTPLARQRLGIAVAERYRPLDELNRSLSQAESDEQDP